MAFAGEAEKHFSSTKNSIYKAFPEYFKMMMKMMTMIVMMTMMMTMMMIMHVCACMHACIKGLLMLSTLMGSAGRAHRGPFVVEYGARYGSIQTLLGPYSPYLYGPRMGPHVLTPSVLIPSVS